MTSNYPINQIKFSESRGFIAIWQNSLEGGFENPTRVVNIARVDVNTSCSQVAQLAADVVRGTFPNDGRRFAWFTGKMVSIWDNVIRDPPRIDVSRRRVRWFFEPLSLARRREVGQRVI